MINDLIGNTKIIKLKTNRNDINLYAKCEFSNPTGSIKDRVAEYILNKSLADGSLKKGQLLTEASSGNMGTSIAAIGGQLGHSVIITCPEKTGIGKIKMIESFGGKVVVCKNTTDTSSEEFYANKALKIAKDNDGFLFNQYNSILNRDCHYDTTGTEIVEYFQNNNLSLDYFVTVGGSGGTVTGCAKKIKENFDTKVIMPDPIGSIYYDLFYTGNIIKENIKSYKVEGPGNPVMCKAMDLKYIDEVMQFNDEDAFQGCRDLSENFGLFTGHSSGANYYAVKKLLKNIPKSKEIKNILILLLDSGMKYL